MKDIVLSIILSLMAIGLSHADTERDAAGNIVSITTRTATGEVVRDRDGKIIERREVTKNADGTRTIVTRDADGKIISRKIEK